MNTQTSKQIADYIKKVILPAVPSKIDQLSSNNVEVLLSKIHVLNYYCQQKDIHSSITDRLEALLETSQVFLELLENNANTFTDLKETYRMRRLDLGAALLGQFEEIISGEESFRDIIITTVANILGWKADTIWVDMAEKGRLALAKSHITSLRNELWKFLADSSQNNGDLTLEKADEIGEKMNLLLQFISDDKIPVIARMMFIAQIYMLLLKLGISRLIMSFETESKKI